MPQAKTPVEKPDYVLNFVRPKNTEIKKLKSGWYLYERSNRYDPTIKRSRKVSGRCLGKITPEGFVPSTRRLVAATPTPSVASQSAVTPSSIEERLTALSVKIDRLTDLILQMAQQQQASQAVVKTLEATLAQQVADFQALKDDIHASSEALGETNQKKA